MYVKNLNKKSQKNNKIVEAFNSIAEMNIHIFGEYCPLNEHNLLFEYIF